MVLYFSCQLMQENKRVRCKITGYNLGYILTCLCIPLPAEPSLCTTNWVRTTWPSSSRLKMALASWSTWLTPPGTSTSPLRWQPLSVSLTEPWLWWTVCLVRSEDELLDWIRIGLLNLQCFGTAISLLGSCQLIRNALDFLNWQSVTRTSRHRWQAEKQGEMDEIKA